MKNSILIFCFITCFVSCKKESPQEKNELSASIIGTWELRQTTAAMNPDETNYLPGNGNVLKFTNASYENYTNGQLVKSGAYVIVKDKTVEKSVCLVIPSGQFMNRIIYDSNYNDNKIFIQFSNNKLTFISGCYAYDARHSSEYERQ